MQTLTDKQHQILEIIRASMERCGQAPTIREIGALANLSSSCTVKKHLDSLEAKGYIRRDRYKRSVDLLDSGQTMTYGRSVSVPLLGRVAGGAPVLAEQAVDPEMIAIPLGLLGRGNSSARDLFALEVCGDSMRDAGIADGDVIVVRRQQDARDGDIVVALLGDEATVKTFYRETDGSVRLQPENPDFSPLICRDVQVMGKVAMAIKRF